MAPLAPPNAAPSGHGNAGLMDGDDVAARGRLATFAAIAASRPPQAPLQQTNSGSAGMYAVPHREQV
jgi:hypothetical protein